MKARIIENTEVDQYPKLGVDIHLLHDRTLWREVSGVMLDLDLQDSNTDSIGLIRVTMSISEAEWLVNKILATMRKPELDFRKLERSGT